MDARETKICISCGRVMTWRKKWKHTWNEVRYCSDRCRGRQISKVDAELEEAIETLLDNRSPTATICPSEAAKAVGGPLEEDWRPLMEPARAAARRLVATGDVLITQKGRAVDPSTAKGPIRIRRA